METVRLPWIPPAVTDYDVAAATLATLALGGTDATIYS